jgi:hypothetical protein
MAAYEVLKEIIRNGSDLTLKTGIAYEVIEELAVLAKASGAKLTVTTNMAYEVVLGLSKKYGKAIAFVDGADK